MTQMHMRFSDYQVKELIERYVHHEVDRVYIQEMLYIRRYSFAIQGWVGDGKIFIENRTRIESFYQKYCTSWHCIGFII